MKKIRLGVLALLVATMGVFSFIEQPVLGGSVRGKVTPADGGLRACAIMGSDTTEVSIIAGSFEIINLKPGTYTIIIKTVMPFKPAAKSGIVVNEGETTELGEFKLESER
jgi:hypothetical protein